MIDHYLTLNGLKFHYLEWPNDGAQAMLLVHGFAGNALTWDVFAEAMARQYRVLALDQRGHGDSDWADEYGTEHAVSDLDAFIRALDPSTGSGQALHRIILVGHSMGGRNSIVYLNRHHDRVDKFIIIDTGPEMNPAGGRRIMGGWQNSQDVFDSREQAFEQLRAVNQRPPLAHHRTRVYHGLKQLPDGQWTWKYDVKLRRGGLRPPPSSQPMMSVDDWWQMWSALACPTLIVHGEVSDLLTRALAEKMAATNPRSTLVTIPGAGHSVPMDRPIEFEAAIKAWLNVHGCCTVG